MAAVSQGECAKAMKSIENKFVEVERSPSVREMAHGVKTFRQSERRSQHTAGGVADSGSSEIHAIGDADS